VQFDRSGFEEEMQAVDEIANRELYETWALRITVIMIIMLAFVFMRKVAIGMIEAMNPPVPKFAGINLEGEKQEVPERVKRHNELLQKLEAYTVSNPVLVAELLRAWMNQGEEKKAKK